MTIVENFNENIKIIESAQSLETIIVGLSGGVDSMVLLHLLCHYKKNNKKTWNIIALYIVHRWNNTEIDLEINQEIALCEKACKSLNVHFEVADPQEMNLAIKDTGSREDYARRIRKAIFALYQNKYNHSIILTGHHLDDSIGTFFIRLMRGSSLSGLSVQPLINHHGYCRPLIKISKKEIIKHAKKNSIAYCHDSANDDKTLLRNKINHDVLPLLYRLEPRAEKTIPRTMELVGNALDTLKNVIEEKYILCFNEEKKELNTDIFFSLNDYLQSEILVKILYRCALDVHNEISHTLIEEIIRFFKNSKSNMHIINTITLKKTKNLVVFQ